MEYEINETKQFVLSPAAGKRLIAKSLLGIPSILEALKNNTIVITAGTTNGYVAEEVLSKIGQLSDFSKKRFFRGATFPINFFANRGKSTEDNKFLGDVVIVKGNWEKGKTIFDVADSLQKGDVVIKGANAVNLDSMQAAVLIGNPTAGTIAPILQASVGRRVEFFLPVGLEKRVSADINKIAQKLNSPKASGLRYMPVNGNVITELEAIKIITGAEAELFAAGGVCGAEGSSWIAVTGTDEQLERAELLFKAVNVEPNFEL